MIVVGVDDGDVVEFDAATRFSTDEHNNLQIFAGREGDRLIQVFAEGCWSTVGVERED